LQFKLKNLVLMNLQGAEFDKIEHKLHLAIDHITPVINNMRFYYKKKTGFKIADHGLANIAFRGNGMAIHVNWNLLSTRDLPIQVNLNSVRVMIDSIYLHFDSVKHGMLYKLVNLFFLNTIKRRIADALAGILQTRITQLDNTINQFLATQPMLKIKERADTMLKSQFERSALKVEEAKDATMKSQYLKSKGIEKPEPYSLTKHLKDTLKKQLVPEEEVVQESQQPAQIISQPLSSETYSTRVEQETAPTYATVPPFERIAVPQPFETTERAVPVVREEQRIARFGEEMQKVAV